MPVESPIPFKGAISESEFSMVQRALLPFWARWYVVFPECVFLFVLFGEGWSNAIAKPLSVLPDLIFASLVAVAMGLLTKYGRRRAWRNHRRLHGAVVGRISNDGLDWKTELSAVNFPWSKVLKTRVTGDIALVYYAPRCAFFLPRSFFDSAGDWDRVKVLLEAHSNHQAQGASNA